MSINDLTHQNNLSLYIHDLTVDNISPSQIGNLEEVLNTGNSAGSSNINMNNNSIQNINTITVDTISGGPLFDEGAEISSGNSLATNLILEESLGAGINLNSSLSVKTNIISATEVLNMNNNTIENVPLPVTSSQVANKQYVDSASSSETLLQVLINGNTSGANQINMNSNKIVNLATPTLGTDAVNKSYVDSSVSSETLSQVLTNGNDGGGLDMTDLGTITATTVNPTNLGSTTLTGTLNMGANAIDFSTPVGSSDQTLMTMGSSSTTRLVFQIGDNANDFNGKIIFGGSGSNISEVPSKGLELSSAGSYLQINNAVSISGVGIIDTNAHIVCRSQVPTIVSGAGAGGVAIIELLAGSDMSGIIYLITTYPGTASSVVATITFASTWSLKPNVILTPSNPATSSLTGNGFCYISSVSTTAFSFSVGSTALPAGTFQWNYMCIY